MFRTEALIEVATLGGVRTGIAYALITDDELFPASVVTIDNLLPIVAVVLASR